MILTCPDCTTSYRVDDAKIPPSGRTVKCASCGHRWTATATAEPPPEEEALPEPPPSGPPAFEPAAELDAELADVPVSALPGDRLPKMFRAKAETSRRVREAAAAGIVWAGMAATLLLFMGAAVMFRVDVVRAWPRTAGAYASVGLPVNALGLEIEGVRFEPALQDGHAALAVSGMIRNTQEHAVETPPLRISLLDKAGERVAVKIARPAEAKLPPGQTRHFAIALLDPPTSAHDLEVAFAPEAAKPHGDAHVVKPGAHKASGHGEPAQIALRGPAEPEHAAPAPVEAQPLPEGSPDALEHHE